MKKLLVTILGGILLAHTAAEATVLTFDTQNNFDRSYGDRVSSAVNGDFSYGPDHGWTPNVAIDYALDDESWMYQEGTGYGDLENVLVMDSEDWVGTTGYTICLRADAGYLVALYGFDFATSDAPFTIDEISVTNGAGTVLLSDSNIAVNDPFISFGGPFPLQSRQLKINITILNPTNGFSVFGLDNVDFAQVERLGRSSARVKTGAVEESSWSDVKGMFR